MPYRDDLSAHQEHAQRLAEELAATRRELAELRAKYARAMAVLRVVAEGKKLEKLLEERRSSLPPASAEAKKLEELLAERRSWTTTSSGGSPTGSPPPARTEAKKLEERRSARPPAGDD